MQWNRETFLIWMRLFLEKKKYFAFYLKLFPWRYQERSGSYRIHHRRILHFILNLKWNLKCKFIRVLGLTYLRWECLFGGLFQIFCLFLTDLFQLYNRVRVHFFDKNVKNWENNVEYLLCKKQEIWSNDKNV